MRFQTLWISAATMMALTSWANAGGLTDAAAAAEAAATAQDRAAWISADAALDDAAWAAGGLYIDQVVATNGLATGYGSYEARPDGPYAAGEPINLYVQPKGYGYGDAGNGLNEIAFDIDLQLLDGTGAQVLEQKDFMQFVVTSRAKARELMVTMTTNLDGAPAGAYSLVYTFRDRHSDQSTEFTHQIEIK